MKNNSADWVIATDENLPNIGQEVILEYDYGDHTTYEKKFWSFEDLKFWKLNNVSKWKRC